jgi:ribosomal protein S18 acetylase RimI-like enzyme
MRRLRLWRVAGQLFIVPGSNTRWWCRRGRWAVLSQVNSRTERTVLTLIPQPPSLPGISIERLGESAPAFEHLTFPRYRALLGAGKRGIVAFAASSGLTPVGLVLAGHHDPKEDVRLLSLAVDAPRRRLGVGGALLRACEFALVEAGCKAMVGYHSRRLPSAPAFEATLSSCGWDAPQLCEVRCAGRCGVLADAIAAWPGVRRLLRNAAFPFSPWSTVNPADDPAIERLSREPTCRPNMSPKSWAGYIEPRVSVAIRRHRELVGWVLLRLDGAENEPTLHCESAYIQHELWRTGVLVAAYLHGYQAGVRHFGPQTIVRFFTGPRMPGMMALTRRRFAPVSLWIDDWMVSRKTLNVPAGNGPSSGRHQERARSALSPI